jgi:uncharacterized protein (DUF2267 family)/predicted transcriptional regulator
MSLEQYCSDKRMVVQSPQHTAYEAARALTNSHVGAVLIQEQGRLVGIVTDRDLAVRVMAAELEPRKTPLGEIMSEGLVTLAIDDTEERAIRLMRARHVRRLPILDGGQLAGMITLDDLLMAGVVDLESAGKIVEVQLNEPAPAKPAGVPHPTRTAPVRASDPPASSARRHQAVAEQTLAHFKARLQDDLGLGDPDRALLAFEVMASQLIRRVTPGEAKDFASQLPSVLRERMLDLPAGPDVDITLDSIEAEMAQRLELDRRSAASLVRQLADCLSDVMDAQEVRHLVQQLPREMKSIFPPQLTLS